jgi:hypothetical protein
MTAATPQPSGASYATAEGGYAGSDYAEAEAADGDYDSSDEGGEGADDEVSFVPLSMGCAEAALPEFLKVRAAVYRVAFCVLEKHKAAIMQRLLTGTMTAAMREGRVLTMRSALCR